MKNTMKKLAFVIALMGGSSLAHANTDKNTGIQHNLNMLQAAAATNTVIADVVKFEQKIIDSIYALLHTRAGDKFYNTEKYQVHVKAIKSEIQAFSNSGLKAAVMAIISQGDFDSDTLSALAHFAELTKNIDAVGAVFKKHDKPYPNTIQLLTDLTPYINWLPEEYRLAVVNDDKAKKGDLLERIDKRAYKM